jgi:hypothetical protein
MRFLHAFFNSALVVACAAGSAHADDISSAPRFVLSADPIGWQAKRYAASAQLGVSEHIALRGDVTVRELDPFDAETRVTGSVQLFPDRVLHGPFVELGMLADHQWDVTHTHPVAYVGWQWLYDSRWSVAVAVGASRQQAALGD